MMGSRRFTLLLRYEFLGSADDGWLEARLSADTLDSGTNRGVRNVLAIPGQEVVHPVDGSHGNVKRICRCPLGHRAPENEAKSELVGPVWQVEELELG
jgi:hypothetical protein